MTTEYWKPLNVNVNKIEAFEHFELNSTSELLPDYKNRFRSAHSPEHTQFLTTAKLIVASLVVHDNVVYDAKGRKDHEEGAAEA